MDTAVCSACGDHHSPSAVSDTFANSNTRYDIRCSVQTVRAFHTADGRIRQIDWRIGVPNRHYCDGSNHVTAAIHYPSPTNVVVMPDRTMHHHQRMVSNTPSLTSNCEMSTAGVRFWPVTECWVLDFVGVSGIHSIH